MTGDQALIKRLQQRLMNEKRIPSEVWHLSALQGLSLRDNQLTTLQLLDLPGSLDELSQKRSLAATSRADEEVLSFSSALPLDFCHALAERG